MRCRRPPGLVLLTLLLACLLVPGVRAEEEAETDAPQMESYQLVLLVRGRNWTPEVTPELRELRKRHLAHLTALAQAGKIVIAGPFSEQDDERFRGLCLYRVGDVAEARRLAESDPAVVSGRLKVEVMNWWVEKGYMTFPRAPGP